METRLTPSHWRWSLTFSALLGVECGLDRAPTGCPFQGVMPVLLAVRVEGLLLVEDF